tara:strand:- start:837 stop:1013 length:177 start_codon:yes stop_codon:yes gene_type:complete
MKTTDNKLKIEELGTSTKTANKGGIQEHAFFMEGRVVKVECTKGELIKYIQKIKNINN